MQLRLIRLRDAPTYLGMDKNRFNKEVRPFLIEIPIGKQGVAFDVLDLDAWVDEYKRCYGRPINEKERLWDERERQAYIKDTVTGTSINRSSAEEFAKALELVSLKKRSAISQNGSKG